MDANFTFPARIPRPSPVQPPTEPLNRESNALRASVLDAALELGFGAHGAVANWMFNNTLVEEDEEESDPVGRGPLSATSDEYAQYSTPPTSTESHSESTRPNYASPNAAPAQVHFQVPEMPPVDPARTASAPTAFYKLRKQLRDGSESDGGYVSDGGKKPRTRTKSKATKDSGPTSAPPISEPMDLIPLVKEERKKKKKTGMFSKDLETDTEDVPKPMKTKPSKPKKTKKSSTDAAAGYETDDGYVSSSGKSKTKGRSRFFSLRKKSDSTSEPAEIEPVPPMPEREVFTLPIASRFATSTGSGDASSLVPSRSETPLLPPSRPFASSASGSSTPSLSSSSANSLLTPSDRESFGAGSLPMSMNEMRYKEEERSGRAPDNSFNPTHTATQDQAFSSPLSPQQSSSSYKFLISYPLTRTKPGSLDSALTPAHDASSRPKHLPSPIPLSPYAQSPNSRAPSPSPMGSTYVLLTPMNGTNAPSGAVSPAPSGYPDSIVPSTEFIVPSRPGSPPPPVPNVLAYYDTPPPTPPLKAPLAPLARVPRAPPSAARGPTPGIARLRSISQDRTPRLLDAASPSSISGRASPSGPTPGIARLRSISQDRTPRHLDVASPSPISGSRAPSPISGRMSPNPISGPASPNPMSPMGATSPGGMQRGRAAPFPSHPMTQMRPVVGVGPGLAARAKVQRYRDLYAIQIPATPVAARDEDEDTDVNIRVEDWDSEGEVEGAEEMLGVLGRFHAREQDEHSGRPLARNKSWALRAGTARNRPSTDAYSDDDEASQYPDDDMTAGRATMYRFDSGGRDTVRWSEYSSRVSLMDVDKSDQARGQLVERIGVMFDPNGRERSAIPPVPKIPAALVGGGNRF